MGRKFIDLTGKKFGRLTVVSLHHRTNTRSYWECKCKCGGTRIVSNDHLKNGDVTDCGCYRRHLAKWKKHGKSGERIYTIWHLMKRRCFDSTKKEYKSYGGRGISVCDEWLDSTTFIEWAYQNGYSDELTLDRIDNNKNYCPENCRWVDLKVQANNRRNNRLITYNGETKTMTQWARENGITYPVLQKRYDVLGWSFERAISEPINHNKSNRKR